MQPADLTNLEDELYRHGLEGFRRIREKHPGLKVIILSMFDDSEHIDQALQRGADGYVVKSINPLDLPSTIRQVVEGTVYHPRGRGGESHYHARALRRPLRT